jgi:DNA-binding response OmpR family regulator
LPKLRTRDLDVPAKVLLVDDDELELSLMADRLTATGFQVTVASNGEEALKILEREWFPLILTDWQMPVMDGIQLIEKFRERGGDDSYFIMLSVRAASEDFERGYCAGVDDYLSKKSTDTEIMARIESGLSTVALRRSLRQSRAALAISQSQSEAANSDAKTQLLTRLQSEISRANRYRRACSVLVLGVHPSLPTANADASQTPAPLDDSARVAFMQALQGVIRIDVDTVYLYETSERHVQFAIVLPETGPAEVAVIRSRVRAALLHTIRSQGAMLDRFDVSIGAASVDPSADRKGLTANELMVAAENCRRCMASCGARRLGAVQSSVVSQVSIPCRHGYAVADHCLELDHRYADESKHRSSDQNDNQAKVASAPVHALPQGPFA